MSKGVETTRQGVAGIVLDVWSKRLVKQICQSAEPVALGGGEAYGAPFLIASLREQRAVAWLKLTPADANDHVALGNLLAEAVNDALKATLLTQALPFTFGIEILKQQLPRLGSLVIACSNAHYSPLFQETLLSLHGGTTVIILDVADVGFVPQGVRQFQPAELALTLEEAGEIVQGTILEDEVATLYRTSRGAYYTFMTGLRRLQNKPDPQLPSPKRFDVPADRERLFAPEVLLKALVQLKRHEEALTLAVMRLPERVPEVLEEAGPVLQEAGLLKRLHLLLESLDAEHQRNETVLSWRLVAGVSQDAYRPFLPEIESFLKDHEAPRLRARYAGVLVDPERQFGEATRAAARDPSPLSLFQLGRFHPDPAVGADILRNSVRLAEEGGRPYEVARNAGALAQRLLHTGRFEQSATWAEWALRFFDQHGLRDGDRRLQLLNIWAYSRLLIGQTVGLDPVLKEAARALDATELWLATLFRSTLGELELVRGNLAEAERLAQDNLMQSPRRLLGEHAVFAVRVLLEKGDLKQALLEGRRAFELTAGEADRYALPGALALGMAQTAAQPDAARPHLTPVMNAAGLSYEYRSAAALHLLVAHKGDTSAIPEGQLELLKTIPLGGLKLLSGPEQVFSGVWQKLRGTERPLHINVLGTPRVLLRGERLKLPKRLLEILTLLGLHPEGLSLEALHNLLYDDVQESTPAGLNVSVSRLRQLIPVSAQPYRIELLFQLDAHVCEHLLDEGRLREALELYQGPLLYESDAPGVREARGWLEERVRQAALHAADTEVLCALGETLKEDVEIWEAALASLGHGDPRLPLVQAHLTHLRGR